MSLSTRGLGEFGIWTAYYAIGEQNAGAAAKLVEDLGYGTFWLGGSPQLSDVRPLLEATHSLIVATGIVNVWDYETAPGRLAAEHAELTREFPGRVLTGIGIGHSEVTSEYRTPLGVMRKFLDELDATDPPLPRDERCLAALGPKMLDVSAARSIGAHPYFTTIDHTRAARQQLGEGVLIAPEVAYVLDADPERGRKRAREYASVYLGMANYRNSLLRLGFSEADLADGGCDEVIDEIIPHGTPADIAAVARKHLDAGADHVALQAAGIVGVPEDEWTAVAAALGLGANQD